MWFLGLPRGLQQSLELLGRPIHLAPQKLTGPFQCRPDSDFCVFFVQSVGARCLPDHLPQRLLFTDPGLLCSLCSH